MRLGVIRGVFLGFVFLVGCGESSGSNDAASGTASTTPSGGSASGGSASGTPNGGMPASSAGSSSGATNVAGGGAQTGNAGSGNGGSSSAGSSSGGSSSGAGTGSGGHAGSTGSGGAAGGAGTPQNKIFSQCRFHFGTIDAKAKQSPSMIPELDFFTPGWMGTSDSFDQKSVCDEAKEGATLGKLVPVIVAYVSAFYVKRHHGNLCDCNVTTCGQTDGKANDLCHFGAQYIKQDLAAITNVYKAYAQGYAGCYGTTRPIIFEMEPDWYQYTISQQSAPLTRAEAGSFLDQYVTAIKQALPNAYFSIDVSPWVDDNGGSNGKDWYASFDLSKFAFVNTSGGGTDAGNTKIRSANDMTWAGVSKVTGKGLLADTGYGANGMSAGHDAAWDMVSNINSRIGDGVLSISQYNPKSDWGSTISGIRSQLQTPKYCP